MRVSILNGAIALVALFVCTRAGAQNLVANGDFDIDLGGWSYSSAVWFSEDCCGNLASGSMRLVGLGAGTDAISGCIEIMPDTAYDLVAVAKTLPGGGLSLAHAELSVLWFSDASCTQDQGHQNILNADALSGWRQLGASVISPSSVQSARVDVFAGGGGLSSSIDLYVDHVRFGLPGTVPVTLQSFVVE